MWDLEFPATPLAWHDGYWAESCAPDDLQGIIAYIRDQRAHHAIQRANEPWQR